MSRANTVMDLAQETASILEAMNNDKEQLKDKEGIEIFIIKKGEVRVGAMSNLDKDQIKVLILRHLERAETHIQHLLTMEGVELDTYEEKTP